MPKRLEIQLYNEKTGESITLPLNPETTDIPNEKDVQTYNILGYGEVQVRGTKRLKRITLSNLLPEDNSFFALLSFLIDKLNYKPYSLQESINMLNRWVDEDAKIRVIISEKLNLLCTISSFTEGVRESIADVNYTIELLEWRNPAEADIKNQGNISKINKLKKRTQERFIPNQKVLQKGMTAYKLCKLTYGGNFEPFMKLNNVINANADLSGKIVEMLPIA